MTQIRPLLPNPSLSDQAFTALSEAITQGTLKAGSPLTKRPIARDLGISRRPLREAILTLERQDLVQRRQNFGAEVLQLAQQNLADLFQGREVLEGRAAGLAAMRIDDAAITDLRRMLDRPQCQTTRLGRYQPPSTGDDFYVRSSATGAAPACSTQSVLSVTCTSASTAFARPCVRAGQRWRCKSIMTSSIRLPPEALRRPKRRCAGISPLPATICCGSALI